jgi:SAM-dependent methyltransferase
MNYRWDNELHLYQSERAGQFDYSDGIEVEQRLLDAVSNAADRSTFSPELARHIQDWPSEYHLSRRRHLLLRPLHIPAGSKVLELGCGCGAITRYLGESGAQVLAVEGSLMRARIAAQRTRDLPKVRVVADDLLHFETDEHFDYVLLIGVLEYAARFSNSERPFESYLRVVTRSFAPGGKLVVAIENQLGLKYLNGCTEDHVGTRFFGVQDLYGGSTARTFGRRDLDGLLRSSGLAHTQFYYPWPDYKLPSAMLTEQALGDPQLHAADVIAHCHARDYNGSPYRAFDEALAADVAHRNGLLGDLSNSFLVVASADALPAAAAEIAFSWSADRIPELCAETVFRRTGASIEVRKHPLIAPSSVHEVRLPGGIVVRHRMQGAGYVHGRQFLTGLKRARARSGDLATTAAVLRPWLELLLEHARAETPLGARTGELGYYQIAGRFLDCIPANLLDDGNALIAIDLEWDSERDIPLGWVVTRGLAWSLMTGLPRRNEFDSVHEVAEAVCRERGLSVARSEISYWLGLEAAFQEAVTGRPWSPADLRHTSGGLYSFNEAVSDLEDLRSQLRVEQSRTADLLKQLGERQEQARALSEGSRVQESMIAAGVEELAAAAQSIDDLRAELASARNAADFLRVGLAKATSGMTWKLAAGFSPAGWRARRRLKHDLDLVRQSGLFDAAWYLAHYPDVGAAGQDPLMHYLEFGAFEGRDPGPAFRTQWYLDQNADVRAGAMNPLVHYLRFGRAEGRKPIP